MGALAEHAFRCPFGLLAILRIMCSRTLSATGRIRAEVFDMSVSTALVTLSDLCVAEVPLAVLQLIFVYEPFRDNTVRAIDVA